MAMECNRFSVLTEEIKIKNRQRAAATDAADVVMKREHRGEAACFLLVLVHL